MARRRPSADAAARAATSAAYDSITLHAFMFTLTLATAVALAYGPAAALHHVAEVLSAAGIPSADPNTWQAVMAY